MAANPFLFQEDDGFDEPANQTNPSNNSNPFLMEDDAAEQLDENPFLSQKAVAASNPFAFDPMELEPAEAEVPVTNSNVFMDTSSSVQSFMKPTDLDLKFSTVPSRPPPPPRPTQSKETQDLLMSVMGAMDATSTHLLDKIPPTRSPSPVSMRDLQSPSPTPGGDLLDVGEGKIITPEDLLNNDVNQNPSLQSTVPPARPSPPVRPPRPAPPQKPPPPKVMRPPSPKNPPPDIMDMFDVSVPPKVATKADILNLYNAPAVVELQPDLLCDPSPSKTPIITENLVEDVFEPNNQTEPVKDSSPEVGDAQMDTSDSQSKGSVSSVTFNPFAAPEESPKCDELVESRDMDKMDIFSTPAPAPTPVPVAVNEAFDFPVSAKGQHDDFDAFAEKFESVKGEESKDGTFDAFGNQETGSVWGNDCTATSENESGFGNDEGFDEFLAMRAPPNKRLESQDSEEEKDFSVVIK